MVLAVEQVLHRSLRQMGSQLVQCGVMPQSTCAVTATIDSGCPISPRIDTMQSKSLPSGCPRQTKQRAWVFRDWIRGGQGTAPGSEGCPESIEQGSGGSPGTYCSKEWTIGLAMWLLARF
jgi:hypothetical protein